MTTLGNRVFVALHRFTRRQKAVARMVRRPCRCCNQTARAMAHVQAQWVVAGIDRDEAATGAGMKARIKNWQQFQHYKDRSPPWVKLHRALLDDFGFSSLPIASKALAPMLWLLAAENMEGEVNADPEWLAFRLRWNVRDVTAGLTPLFNKGFLESDSSVLASCEQVATPETETETETETTLGRQADRFDEFWNLYPKKVGKKPARDKWKAKKLDAKADLILTDVANRIRADRRWLEGYVPNPATYITQERWNDELQGAPQINPAVPRGKPAGPSETPLERSVAWARQQHAYGAIDETERDRLIGEATAKHRGQS